MHGFTYLAALHDEGSLYALALANQIMVDSRNRQQGRDGCVGLVDVAVGKDDVVHPFIYAHLSLFAQIVKGLMQSVFSLFHFKECCQLLGFESFIADVT